VEYRVGSKLSGILVEQIKVRGLKKVFSVSASSGKAGQHSGLFKKKQKKNIVAVDSITFSVEKGETLAFIGPNGAGKSTTIKMLTGILYPTSGSASVAGYNPWKERLQLAFKIGTVFGQKSQLSFHLPARDSFRLFSRIYEVDGHEYDERLSKLVEIFDVEDFLDQPLRKLSLGQRMRCEIIASLLHNPEVIFLDEPTIGLDVVAKRNLRDVLRDLNKEWKTTIFLTSHDTGDIEALCRRTIVVNHGRIVYDGKTVDLKRKYIKVKRLYARFEEKLEKFGMKDVTVISEGKYGVFLEIDTQKRSIRSVLEEMIDKYSIIDINVEDPTLEEIISSMYQEGNESSAIAKK